MSSFVLSFRNCQKSVSSVGGLRGTDGHRTGRRAPRHSQHATAVRLAIEVKTIPGSSINYPELQNLNFRFRYTPVQNRII